jgi:hypothetical protein
VIGTNAARNTRAADRCFDAFHLPGIDTARLEFDERRFGGAGGNGVIVVRMPRATPALVAAAIQRLLETRLELQQRPAGTIVDALAAVGERLARPGPERRAALEVLPAVTGYSPQMVAVSLDWVGSALRREELSALLTRELGDAEVLDRVRPRGDAGRMRAFGAPLVAHFFSGNVPGIAALSLSCALLVKSVSLGKTATDEPVFAALFARLLSTVDPLLGRAVAILGWRGGEATVEQIVLDAADAVVAYGSDAAIDSIRRRTPGSATLVAYGHKLSFAVIGREAVGSDRVRETARLAARDVCTFDQQACLSPHVLYVEGGADSALAFAHALAEEMAAFEADVPRGRIGPAEAAAIHQLRGAYELRSFAEPGVDVIASEDGTAWTVLVDADPHFEASCLNRCVRVKPITDLHDVRHHVAGISRWLQTVGICVAADRIDDLTEQLGSLGVTRVCPLGTMATPSLAWRHDGRANLLDLVRWVDCEGPCGVAGRGAASDPIAPAREDARTAYHGLAAG